MHTEEGNENENQAKKLSHWQQEPNQVQTQYQQIQNQGPTQIQIQQKSTQHRKAGVVTWHPPPSGCIKCNVDGAFCKPAGSGATTAVFRKPAGSGATAAVFRDSNGRINKIEDEEDAVQNLEAFPSPNLVQWQKLNPSVGRLRDGDLCGLTNRIADYVLNLFEMMGIHFEDKAMGKEECSK
ncbi:hypothetical protein PIB30_018453 [Stylosanthes scabra]|uniref:RNase H type-1 domain-containing protein n=1 Tax=Stylosanthes scabra TaxID=79078 RepID=A0ABU6U848_9FABA|nr:hypothetical protein [Stylosanthes scabra]